jgi:hypothetical protein
MKYLIITIITILSISIANAQYSYNKPQDKDVINITSYLPRKDDTEHLKDIRHDTRHMIYASTVVPSTNSSKVYIYFHTREKFNEMFPGRIVNGFAKIHDNSDCEIHAMNPYNWNDDDAMRTIGHELMHCMGASHEKLARK